MRKSIALSPVGLAGMAVLAVVLWHGAPLRAEGLTAAPTGTVTAPRTRPCRRAGSVCRDGVRLLD